MPRYWRIVSNFHTIGEVIKVVQAPNWQGGLRKGALAIKADARLKGRKITVASFTLQETTAAVALEHWRVAGSPFGEGTPNTLGAQARMEATSEAEIVGPAEVASVPPVPPEE